MKHLILFIICSIQINAFSQNTPFSTSTTALPFVFDEQLEGFNFISPSVGFAIQSPKPNPIIGTNPNPYRKFYRTIDGGNTWQFMSNLTTPGICSGGCAFEFSSSTTGFIEVFQYEHGFTKDGGATFENPTVPGFQTNYPYYFIPVNDDSIFLFKENIYFKKTNDLDWTLAGVNTGYAHILVYQRMPDTKTYYGVNYNPNNSQNDHDTLFVSYDRGLNWTSLGRPSNYKINTVRFHTPTTGTITTSIGNTTYYLETTNSGLNWAVAPNNVSSFNYFYSRNTSGPFQYNDSLSYEFNSSDKKIYVTKRNKTSIPTEISNNSILNEGNEIYPNPFDQDIFIVSSGLNNESPVLYNGLMTPLNVSVLKEAQNKYKLNVQDLQPGIYYIRNNGKYHKVIKN